MTIGEKIKYYRTQKGLTQKELSCDRITRNMISAIESNKATPSLETLFLISNALGLPVEFLISEDEDPFPYVKQKKMKEIYSLLSLGDYRSVAHIVESLGGRDDETSYILANCYYNLGVDAMRSGALQTTVNLLTKCLENCNHTSFDTGRYKAFIPLYLAIAGNATAPLLEFDQSKFLIDLYKVFDYEFYKYLVQDHEFRFSHVPYAQHLEAKQLMKDRRYIDALDLLTRIEQTRRDYQKNAYLIFCVYGDIEICHKELCDFENAYKYSTKRISLIEGFQS